VIAFPYLLPAVTGEALIEQSLLESANSVNKISQEKNRGIVKGLKSLFFW